MSKPREYLVTPKFFLNYIFAVIGSTSIGKTKQPDDWHFPNTVVDAADYRELEKQKNIAVEALETIKEHAHQVPIYWVVEDASKALIKIRGE